MMLLIDDHIHEYSPQQIGQWLDELPEWRRRQALAFKHDAGRRQCLLAYRLLCQGLREGFGIAEPPTFEYGEHGKPFLNEELRMKNEEFSPTPFFSLSHCRDAVACIIDDRPCGIDIEASTRKVSDSLIRHCMTDAEIEDIMRHAPGEGRESTFLRLWTQKEAVAKLLGTGIRDDFKNILHKGNFRIETQETERWTMSTAQCP